MRNNRFVTYTEDDRAIVKQGIEAIKKVLLGLEEELKPDAGYVCNMHREN